MKNFFKLTEFLEKSEIAYQKALSIAKNKIIDCKIPPIITLQARRVIFVSPKIGYIAMDTIIAIFKIIGSPDPSANLLLALRIAINTELITMNIRYGKIILEIVTRISKSPLVSILDPKILTISGIKISHIIMKGMKIINAKNRTLRAK